MCTRTCLSVLNSPWFTHLCLIVLCFVPDSVNSSEKKKRFYEEKQDQAEILNFLNEYSYTVVPLTCNRSTHISIYKEMSFMYLSFTSCISEKMTLLFLGNQATVSCEVYVNTKNQTVIRQDCYPEVRHSHLLQQLRYLQ